MDISFSREPGNTFVVRLGGRWNIAEGIPSDRGTPKANCINSIPREGCIRRTGAGGLGQQFADIPDQDD